MLAQSELEPGQKHARGGNSLRVLLAEDCNDSRALFTYMLENMGFDVTAVADGADALQLIKDSEHEQHPEEKRFDLIVLDIQMPKLDGYNTAAGLRGLGLKTPIIAMTSAPVKSDYEEYSKAGCTFFIKKSELGEYLPRFIRSCFI